MNDFLILIFQFCVFLFSVIIHEVSHGVMALRLGDTTAKNAGRLTLNPLKHLDFFGSIILPITLILTNSPILFGWAKPVPYNPNNLKNPKLGSGLIGAAGPISNLSVAIIFGIITRLIFASAPFESTQVFLLLMNYIVYINVLLAIFNLLPIPPLDGSGILFSILPAGSYKIQEFLTRYGFVILIGLLLFGLLQFISPIIYTVFRLIIGPVALL